MPKIVINSNPRTGISRLLEFVRIAYNRTNKKDYGEYSNRKDFVIWTHVPVMLLSNFDDILQITIVRNPDEVIPSICDKLDSGIGLDVHDKGHGGSGLLKTNMVITVEPGIYIPANSKCDKKWWNIGVRIEDDIVIQKDSFENLSAESPRKWEDIEKLIAKKSKFNEIYLPKLKVK
jgi:hypothetical protein